MNYHASEEGTTAAAAALDVIDEAPAVTVRGPATEVVASGTLALDGVTVRHPGREKPSLDRVHFVAKRGEIVALGGESGGGKSTVIAALLGFVGPASGEVLVGVEDELLDLVGLDADRWRANLAWLPQRPVPSQATIADEVRLGDPAASDQAVARACRECRTPAPSTPLGEDGRWVSAGQRRRIALARVLLRARAVQARGAMPIVLLDEPSEDLDNDTELVVAGVITDLAGWASVVIATHSELLSSLANRRVTLAHGRVIGDIRQRPVRAEQVLVAPLTPPRSHACRSRGRIRRRRCGCGCVSWRAARACDVGSPLPAHCPRSPGLTGLGLTGSSMWLISRAAQHPNVQELAIAVVGVRMFAIARALLRYPSG